MWIRFFVTLRPFFFIILFGSFIIYLVAFNLYLPITLRKKNRKRVFRRRGKSINIWTKVDKGKGGVRKVPECR